MSLATLKTDLLALETAIVAASPSPILRAVGPVEADVADIIDLFMPPAPPAGSAKKAAAPPTFGSDPNKAECLSCCDRIEAACKTMKAAPVGSWGDGTLFTIFLQNLPALIAMIRDLIGK